jgi:glutamyl-tRNA reductase
MLAVIGLTHKTAPLDVRELVAVPEAEIPRLLEGVAAVPGVTEAVVLSTCNRTELYVTTMDHPPVDRLAAVLAGWGNIPVDAILPHLRAASGEDAARHALRVAAGLESMVVGEAQVLGQLRRAFTAAREAGTAGPILNRLMQVAIGCGRRARAETGLGRRAASIPHAAMRRARTVLGTLGDRRLAIVGAGEMAELVAKVFTHAEARLVAVANRTAATAAALAARYGAMGIGLDGLRDVVRDTEVLVVSIGADDPVLIPEILREAGPRSTPLLVIDIGVPRGVAPQVRALPDVILYDLDELQPPGSADTSESDLAQANEIVEDALDAFMRWLGGRSAVPVIAALHARAERIIDEELHRARGRLSGLDEHQRRAVRGVIEGAVRKLLHAPFVRLRAQGEDARALTLARTLFDLEDAP